MSVISLIATLGSSDALPNLKARPGVGLDMVLNAATQNVAQNDVVVLAYIPPRTFVQVVRAEVQTVEGGVATGDLGIFSNAGVTPTDADGFIVGIDLNALTHANSRDGAAAYSAKGFTTGAAGAYLCLTALNALDAAKIKVVALCHDLS